MKANYVFIDFENVSPDNLDMLNKDWIRLFLFIGGQQKKLPVNVVTAMQDMGERAKYIQIEGVGPNALDFHIAYYIGRISEECNDAFFHIVSKDTGFDPLISHLRKGGIYADRVASIQDIPALIASAKSPADRAAIVKERISRENATKPRSRKTLHNHIAAMFMKTLSNEEIEDLAEIMFASGFVRETGKRLIYEFETSSNSQNDGKLQSS